MKRKAKINEVCEGGEPEWQLADSDYAKCVAEIFSGNR
jgi:hypothetical protein